MRNILCIGGATGSLEALQRLVRRLPADLPAVVLVVRHIAPESSGELVKILQPYCALPVSHAQDGEPIQPARLIIAPPDRHLVLDQTEDSCRRGPQGKLDPARHRSALPLRRAKPRTTRHWRTP